MSARLAWHDALRPASMHFIHACMAIDGIIFSPLRLTSAPFWTEERFDCIFLRPNLYSMGLCSIFGVQDT
jgi:hypothetical protein